MERNKKIRGVRPFACPNKPPGRISLWRYSNSVYRKNAGTDVSRDTNFHPVWTGDRIGSVLSANDFLSVTNFIIHIYHPKSAFIRFENADNNPPCFAEQSGQ
jgi:hypothetical protein